ncbi:MAG: PIN domain-containing protein [Planctomycetes bacterium]|nr:PIN domain-containing protein [Planctomycetota bacterium]
MVLVDTSIWVSHLRNGSEALAKKLREGIVVCHPFVIGELACGNLKNRREILESLQALPTVEVAEQIELLEFIENKGIMGKGLGWIDMHLIASSLLSHVQLWTSDKRLKQVATDLDLS